MATNDIDTSSARSSVVNDASSFAEQQGQLDLREALRTILAHVWWLIGSVVLVTAAFIVASHVLTPIYRANTVLIPAKSDSGPDTNGGGSGLAGGIGGVASLVGINIGQNDEITEEAMGVLKSREFIKKFIEDRHLMPVLYASKWDAATGRWKSDVRNPPTIAKGVRYFQKRIMQIVPEKKTSLITIDIDWKDRFAAADWANELVQRLNLRMRQREMARADLSIAYLEKQFDSATEVATRQAIAHLIEVQVKQRMMANVTDEFAFRVIDHATPPDADDRYFPNRLIFAIAGVVLGLLIGLVAVFTVDKLPSRTRKSH